MLSIRKATPEDNPRAREIVARSLDDFGITVEFDGLDLAIGSIGTERSMNTIELLAIWDGEICACLALQAIDAHIAKLSGFHVAHEYRGKGIGKSLLKAATQAATQFGFTRLKLDTWDTMHAAIALYTSLGWQRDADPRPESGSNRSYFLDLV
ncbi:MAG: GNAT family N-acetyltransferase [Pseudomonadota bacterium]